MLKGRNGLDLGGNYKTPFGRKSALALPIGIFCKLPKSQKVMSICKKPNRQSDHRICTAKRVLQFPRMIMGKFSYLPSRIQCERISQTVFISSEHKRDLAMQ